MTWTGRPVLLVGGGPSLRGFDFNRLRGRGAVVVGINDAMLHVPWADAVLSIDTAWLVQRQSAFLRFAGERIAIVPGSFDRSGWPGVTWLDRRPVPGLSHMPDAVCTGENSGYAALGLAVARGADPIGLLGYDLVTAGHWHAGYRWKSRYGAPHYARWALFFDNIAPELARRGVRVVNINTPRGTAIRGFRLGSLEDVLDG